MEFYLNSLSACMEWIPVKTQKSSQVNTNILKDYYIQQNRFLASSGSYATNWTIIIIWTVSCTGTSTEQNFTICDHISWASTGRIRMLLFVAVSLQ